jgi:hypothetical protein
VPTTATTAAASGIPIRAPMGPQMAAPMNTAARAMPEFTSMVRLLTRGVNTYVSICWYTVANRMIHNPVRGVVKTTNTRGTAIPM